MKAKYRHFGCRITDELIYKGMNTIFMENEIIKIGILIDKGADIFQFIHKPTDTDFMWKSPNGLLNPKDVKESISSLSGAFLDNYHGGWQEILPGGGPYVYKGAEIGLHGDATQIRWEFDISKDEEDCIEIILSADFIRMPIKILKKLRLEKGQPCLFIEETLTNLSNEVIEFMWGQHPAFGAPFLQKNNKLYAKVKKAEIHSPKFMESGIFEEGKEFDWPMIKNGDSMYNLSIIGSVEDGFGELIYLKDIEEGWYAIINEDKKIGFGLAWDKEIFAHIWFWLVYGNSPGYPWWNRAYCVALEPWTSYPNTFENAKQKNTLLKLKGNESITVPFTAVAIDNARVIEHIGIDGNIVNV